MAIEGLRTVPEPNPNINISDAVGASVQALDMLGLVADHEQVTDSITAEFGALSSLLSGDGPMTGEAYIQIPRKVISLPRMIEVLDGAKYPGDREYPDTWVYRDLWVPGTNKGSLEAEDIGNLELGNQGDFPVHARAAVLNPNNPDERLLHYLGQPYDEMYAREGEETQLQSFATSKTLQEAAHPDSTLTPLNANAVAMIALTRRIKGQDMPFEWGFMRDATLPRRTVGGDSVVGRVDSCDGRLLLGRSRTRVSVSRWGQKSLNLKLPNFFVTFSSFARI
jgi:hypothetical protein